MNSSSGRVSLSQEEGVHEGNLLFTLPFSLMGTWGFVPFPNAFPLCNFMCQRSVQPSLTTWKTGTAAFLYHLASGEWKAEM